MNNALSYHALHTHFFECGVLMLDASLGKPALEKVVIRGEHADFQLAAVHREGNVLILDLGQKIDD